ncbi:hypothetical protein CANMA_002622 [Candida margitis]|uniref:uncharacterized protein n=1 Tax=Candida margitis TaxID=1775924 RepID=UPI00222759A0|nr:uncharacterized protein CANMA_002622 [Candida margitis]KAI5967854.1 hypothetical protein CANMA_002622 [Candida margitis]
MPRNSYVVNKTYPLLIWNNLIPYQLKYLSGLGAGVLAFINLHPQIWISLGPPMSVAGYYLNKKIKHNLYVQNANRAGHRAKEQTAGYSSNKIVKILPYDEAQLYNLQEEIDNEYDSLRKQIVDLAGKRIIEYITSNPKSIQGDETLSSFIDNSQFNINMFENEVESWVTSQVKLPGSSTKDDDEFKRFIKLSVPYYNEKTLRTRKRLGVIAVYLLKLNEIDWVMSLEVCPVGWWKSKSTWIREIESIEHMESQLYKRFSNV